MERGQSAGFHQLLRREEEMRVGNWAHGGISGLSFHHNGLGAASWRGAADLKTGGPESGMDSLTPWLLGE